MLFEAVYDLLVAPNGPLDNLFLLRLPDRDTSADVDVAFVPVAGIGPERAFGKTDYTDSGIAGLDHDGGVLWNHSGVQFHFRAANERQVDVVVRTADTIRDILNQYTGGAATESLSDGSGSLPDGTARTGPGERIYRVEVTGAPVFYEQDDRGRAIMALTADFWHKSIRS